MSEQDKIDKKSGKNREGADPSREEQLNLLQTITMEVAAASDLSSALHIVLRRVCEKTGWTLGQAWLPDSNGAVLCLGPCCYCGNGELNNFRTICQSMQFES